ncbi:acetylornithine deacetylase [Oceanicella actignis]|uniref:Acetylornithine deacetylase n=1 Tax=Oceanicella actignis TaxID=1189325 RepID=A0A1M7TPL4_9RHOB|nr:acetylornithine deacetylase [Oceanicella actignis]SET73680.1 acetylornithine deacetylase [Oceanicella actignis]SHN72598.1 acetylornithine deacetylase [Oceanicella actignis]
MSLPVSDAIAILADLVRFRSLSGRSNLDIIGYMTDILRRHGVAFSLDFDDQRRRANLFATIGPRVDGGVALSGHTDVVPVEGQAWTRPPFELTREGERLYGRGATDMKGFLACALAMVPRFARADLARPVHLAFTYDEEPGSIGAPGLARHIIAHGPRPAAVIVGEPTEGKLVVGHKGGFEMRTRFRGVPAHSSDPARGVSAIHWAARFVVYLEKLGRRMAADADPASAFRPPCNTVNVGVMRGGAGRSIIAEDCALDWELRVTPPDDGRAAMARIMRWLARAEAEMQAACPRAAIMTETISRYPGLAFDPTSPALAIVRAASGVDACETVPFGADAGCFAREGLPAVLFGPGSIRQAHVPDEHIEIAEIASCLRFLERLGERLAASA